VTTTLTLTTQPTTTPGSYTISVTGTSAGSLNATTTFTVFVPVAPPSFTLSSTAVTIASPGPSGTSTITITPSGGFTGNVALSCAVSGGPTGGADAPTCSVTAPSGDLGDDTRDGDDHHQHHARIQRRTPRPDAPDLPSWRRRGPGGVALLQRARPPAEVEDATGSAAVCGRRWCRHRLHQRGEQHAHDTGQSRRPHQPDARHHARKLYRYGDGNQWRDHSYDPNQYYGQLSRNFRGSAQD
jgi:hypothetical protein